MPGAPAVYDRYRGRPGASVGAHEAGCGAARGPVTDTFRHGDALPGGALAAGTQLLDLRPSPQE